MKKAIALQLQGNLLGHRKIALNKLTADRSTTELRWITR
jgi:hypothetical protein